eukprot:3798533-Amphidinium_carterae.1
MDMQVGSDNILPNEKPLEQPHKLSSGPPTLESDNLHKEMFCCSGYWALASWSHATWKRDPKPST